MKDTVKHTLILTVITLISGLLLGTVYEITKEPIAKEQERIKNEAYRTVLEEAKDFQNVEIKPEAKEILSKAGLEYEDITEVVKAQDADGKALGYVIGVVTHEGYGGDIEISVGMLMDGTVTGVEILSISETAGLGMRANTPEFKAQFADKKVKSFEYTKNGAQTESEIDALSGATITSNAMTNGVNAALTYFYACEGGASNE